MITLYHGSNIEINQIDLSLSRKGKDFGCGFYLNANKQQATEMAAAPTIRQMASTALFSKNAITRQKKEMIFSPRASLYICSSLRDTVV